MKDSKRKKMLRDIRDKMLEKATIFHTLKDHEIRVDTL